MRFGKWAYLKDADKITHLDQLGKPVRRVLVKKNERIYTYSPYTARVDGFAYIDQYNDLCASRDMMADKDIAGYLSNFKPVT